MSKDQDYRSITEKIIESDSFGKSEIYTGLLKYLVEGTLTGNIPKETVIASEIFGKNAFHAQDAQVRVHVFNLRKKLEKYYSGDGITDQVILTIPKGGYRVEFIDRKTWQRTSGRKNILIVTAVLSLMLIVSLFFNIAQSSHDVPESREYQDMAKSSIWSDVFNDKLPFQMVVGDLFVYGTIDPKTREFITSRNYKINSLEEFEDYRMQYPDTNEFFIKQPFSLLTTNTGDWVKNVAHLFYANGKDFSIRYSSQFSGQDLTGSNILIAGMFKSMGEFNEYSRQSHFKYVPRKYIEVKVDSGKILTYKNSGDPTGNHIDYAILAKFPGPSHSKIFYCGGMLDTGAGQCVRMLTDPVQLAMLEAEIKKKLGSVPPYFEVFLEVTGINRMEVVPRILYVNKLEEISDQSPNRIFF